MTDVNAWLGSATALLIFLSAPASGAPTKKPKAKAATVTASLPMKESTWSDIMPKGAKMETMWEGFKFLEGPVWTRDKRLIYSDTPADTLYMLNGVFFGVPQVVTYRIPANNPNGNTLDPQGRLITCEHGSRSVTRTDEKGDITTLVDRYDGKRLNSPNDVVVRSDGQIYFTDPPYGISQEQEELGFYGVYKLSKDGKLTLLVRDFVRPNGLAFSPDEKHLYIDDTDRKQIRVFDVKKDGTLENGRVFVEVKGSGPGAPDGMRVDVKGNVYCTGPGGIHVYTPSGKELGVIPTPQVAANCAWGGDDAKTLYITAGTALYRIRLKIPGKRW